MSINQIPAVAQASPLHDGLPEGLTPHAAAPRASPRAVPASPPDKIAAKITVSNPARDGSVRFVNFVGRQGESVGSISKDVDNPGITIEGVSGDFAEWHPRESGQTPFEEGDVVGFADGVLTRSTRGACMAGVISKRALIKGSRPLPHLMPQYDTVAYCGQVPVKLWIPAGRQARAGDVVLTSGLGDGCAALARFRSAWERHCGPPTNPPPCAPRPILPNFPVLARACLRCLERSHLVLTSPFACSQAFVGI